MKSKVVLFDIDYTLFRTDVFKKSELKTHSVYEEVYEVLKELSKTAKLAIFSEGKTDFQKAKLIKTNINKYFKSENIHIFKSKEDVFEKVLKKYPNEQIFFVDDKLNILYSSKKLMPEIFTIWVKRGFYALNQKEIKNFSPDAVVKNLKEIVSLIHNS